MPFKRDREEDEAPVVVRGGAGVEALTGGRNITIDTLAAEMEKMTKKIDAYVTEVAEKNKQIEVKNQQIEEKDKQVVKMAIQIEERNQKMAAMSTANQMHGKYTLHLILFLYPAAPLHPIHLCESLFVSWCVAVCVVVCCRSLFVHIVWPSIPVSGDWDSPFIAQRIEIGLLLILLTLIPFTDFCPPQHQRCS